MRKDFEMSEQDFKRMQDAHKPIPMMIIGNAPPLINQDVINELWMELSNRMGFDVETVQLSERGWARKFTAEVK